MGKNQVARNGESNKCLRSNTIERIQKIDAQQREDEAQWNEDKSGNVQKRWENEKKTIFEKIRQGTRAELKQRGKA